MRFVPSFAETIKPLQDRIKKNMSLIGPQGKGILHKYDRRDS